MSSSTFQRYCMGGILALAYVSLYPEGVRNFVAQATPVDFSHDCYQQNLFCQGRMEVGGERVEWDRIRCSVLNVIAEQDTIAPPPMSEPLPRLVGSQDTQTLRFPVGHIGLSASSKSPTKVWPAIADWLIARSRPLES
jgi:polyhydroxyalkanoate synthase